MNFYTIADLDNVRVFELDNRTYTTIRDKFARMAGVNGANKLMWKWRDKTLRELSCNSFVDVLSCVQFMG